MKNYFSDVNQLDSNRFKKYYDALKIVDQFEQEYRDADKYSKLLYQNLAEQFYPDVIPIKIYGSWTLMDGTTRLGSDYIGPSRYFSYKAGLNGEEIFELTQIARTLGGHMLWPRNGTNGSINTARGASLYHDRIDLALYAIKCWYEGDAHLLLNKKMVRALNDEVTRKWLLNFWQDLVGFEKFMKHFKLESFVDRSFQVFDLTSYEKNDMAILTNDINTAAKDKEAFEKYIAGNLQCIKRRNEQMNT